MDKKELSQAFSGLHAPDALVRQVLAPAKPQKRPVRVWQIARRVAVCATVLALLVILFVTGTNGDMEPYFSVYVYANETDSVELSCKGSTFFVPAYDSSNAPSKKDDPSYRPEFDSSLGAEGTTEPVFYLSVYLNDETKDYDCLTVFVDGQQLEPNVKEGFVGYKYKEGEIGRFVWLNVKKVTRLDIVFYDDNGKELQHYGMSIEPVEGGWLVTLDKTYLSVRESGIFSGLC